MHVFIGLIAALSAAAAPQPGPDEAWGAYNVRHVPLGGLYSPAAVTKDGLIAAIAFAVDPGGRFGSQLYFLHPDGRLAGQTSETEPFRLNPSLPPVLLRDGTVAAVTESGKVIFASPEGRKVAEYVPPGPMFPAPVAVVALRNGLLALGLRPARILLLDSRGKLRREISGKAMLSDNKESGAARIIEMPDGRLLVEGYSGTYLSGGGNLRPWKIAGEGNVRPLLVLRDGSIVARGRMGLVIAGLDGALKKELDLKVAGTYHDAYGAKDRESLAGVMEMHDGGLAVTTMQGHLFILGKNGRERWRFKVPGTIFSEALELKNGGLVVGSSAGYLFFLTRDGALQGRYPTDNNVVAAPVEMEDGVIVAGTSMERGTSHNLYVFSPTGRPFIPAPSLYGRNCRVAGKLGGAMASTNGACPDQEAFIDEPTTQQSANETCLRAYPGSRAVRFHDYACRVFGKDSYGRDDKNLMLYFDCEVCSDAP
jgi:outer membrane protein assembly factor BamB